MQIEDDAMRSRILESHRNIFWALRHTVFWSSFSILIFGVVYALCESGAVSEAHRLLLFVVVATLLIIASVWQSAGFVLARLTLQTRVED